MDDSSLRRAGMDYWELVDWRYHDSFDGVMMESGLGSTVYCVETTGEQSYAEARYRPGDFLVFGRETRGLRRATIERAGGRCVRIPIAEPRARSLNLSNAVAIVLYEALRQNGFGDAG